MRVSWAIFTPAAAASCLTPRPAAQTRVRLTDADAHKRLEVIQLPGREPPRRTRLISPVCFPCRFLVSRGNDQGTGRHLCGLLPLDIGCMRQ